MIPGKRYHHTLCRLPQLPSETFLKQYLLARVRAVSETVFCLYGVSTESKRRERLRERMEYVVSRFSTPPFTVSRVPVNLVLESEKMRSKQNCVFRLMQVRVGRVFAHYLFRRLFPSNRVSYSY
jgi:hypothetical protein